MKINKSQIQALKTKQDVINFVFPKIIAQGKQSVGIDRRGRYRGLNGCLCPLGFMIADDIYLSNFEVLETCSAVDKELVSALEESGLPKEIARDKSFMSGLQDAHDEAIFTVDPTGENFLSEFCDQIKALCQNERLAYPGEN